MPNLILPGRRRSTSVSERQYASRMNSAMELVTAKCSLDINRWKITQLGRPDWAPKSTHHALLFRDTTNGYEKLILIDRNQADSSGNFESEHKRITEAFTRTLRELGETVRYLQQCKMFNLRPNYSDLAKLGQFRELEVRDDLHRGDHDNDFAS